MGDAIEIVVRSMVREAHVLGKMPELILGWEDFWNDKAWSEKYKKIAQAEFKKLLKEK